MPNILDADGLQTATRDEILADLTTELEAAYGPDINVASDTPDGQWLNNGIAQPALDNEDLLTQIYTGFDPDQAIGKTLDQRVTINGIQRQAGIPSQIDITIITNAPNVSLPGLDQTLQAPYTIADGQGNQWFLKTSIVIAGAGTSVCTFESAFPGVVLVTDNTINIPITIIIGVATVNNPPGANYVPGKNEETDAALRLRRQQSVSLASQGYLAGLLAALLNVTGVTSAEVFENDSDTTDINGVPSHSIWVIVAGAATDADIAKAIFLKRNAGCGMFGSISFVVDQITGAPFTDAPGQQPFVIRWDAVTSQDLFIKFTATSLDGINPPNIALIRTTLPTVFIPGVNEQVNINDLATLVQEIEPNALVTNAGFSTSHGGSYTPTLSPTLKTEFFHITAPNIDILPMQSSPSAATVVASGTQIFQGVGGFGAYIYAVHTNNSGSPGFTGQTYKAGATPNVVDVIRITDADGNFVDANVSVTP